MKTYDKQPTLHVAKSSPVQFHVNLSTGTSNEVQHVENWWIFFNNLCTFKIDLRKLWNQRPVRSFRRAHRRRKMRACMMLKSTETIAIEDAFPSRAALLLRRSFHNIRYNLCVWRRSWRWVRRCPATPSSWSMSGDTLDWFSNLVQLNEFVIVVAVIGWN